MRLIEQEALVLLNAIPSLSNRRIKALIDHFGSALRLVDCTRQELESSGLLNQQSIDHFFRFSRDSFLKSEYDLIAKGQINIVTYLDSHYPQQLAEIEDAPIVLYFKGNIVLNWSLPIAIVGSRKASIYGMTVANQFAGTLSEAGATIVSGMARGIDTAAHKGVLRAKGQTVAVLGCGLSHVYPSENKRLMDEISQSGAVISEFPMKTRPLPFNFPRRNRIVSGLSNGVIVVEAAQRSGALITADFALEQGREVFAVPGKVNVSSSGGVNRLIQQGAKLITSPQDVLDELDLYRWSGVNHQNYHSTDEIRNVQKRVDVTEQEELIYQVVSDQPKHIDEIMNHCDQSQSTTYGLLLQLELKRLIKQLPGKHYTRSF